MIAFHSPLHVSSVVCYLEKGIPPSKICQVKPGRSQVTYVAIKSDLRRFLRAFVSSFYGNCVS